MEKDDGLVIMKKPKKKMARKMKKAEKKYSKKVITVAKKIAKSKNEKIAAAKPVQAAPAQEKTPRCIVLAGFGLNAEAELADAFTRAGADVDIVHFSDIASRAKRLSNYQIFAIPGGWSFGDDIAGGRVLANKLKNSFRADFEEFVTSGKPVLGICNGFQTLVKLGALPNLSGNSEQEATLYFNKSGRFEDRWIYLKPQKSVCRYFEGVEFVHCPVRHGEGQFVANEKVLDELEKCGMVALKYVDEKMGEANYPDNPNGSARSIAGICDRTGKILGLMPHPECSVRRETFPRFTSGVSSEKNSLRFFENIVNEGRKHA